MASDGDVRIDLRGDGLLIVVGKLDQLIPTMGKRHAIMQMHIPAR